MDPERRQALLWAKLAALVRDQWGPAERAQAPFPGGAGMVAEGHGWVLVEDRPERSLGGALAWAGRHHAEHLHVIVDAGSGVLTRRAAYFDPAPDVWEVKSRFLVEGRPAPLPVEPEVGVEATVFEDLIRGAGAEPIVEQGILRGEVLGLEVARVEDGRLLVGVGKHDREAHLMAYPDRPAAEGLAVTVQAVREYRRPHAGPSPANQLSLERWLRAAVIAHPEMAGLPAATELRPVPSPLPRDDLRQSAPAAALGDGVMVVCSVGIDTDFVPAAADTWAAHGRPTRLLLAVPEGDDHAVTRMVASRLAHPAEVVTVTREWREVLAADSEDSGTL